MGRGDVRRQSARDDRGSSSSSDGASTPFGLGGPPPDAATEELAFSGVDDERLFAELRSRLFARGEVARVGRYRLLHRLGAGAMGEVHLAVDDELDRPIAIKLVHPHLADPRSTARLRGEARALARLAHPNVVHVYEVGEHDGRTYLAMERIEGGSLREWLGGRPAPRWEQVLAAYVDAGRGLAAAHRAGVIHRDFKPDNVLRAADGRVAVVDFGLAALERGDAAPDESRAGTGTAWPGLGPTLDRTSEIAGTPAYMPPEQFRGHADARADQFALCVSLYEGLWAAGRSRGGPWRTCCTAASTGCPPSRRAGGRGLAVADPPPRPAVRAGAALGRRRRAAGRDRGGAGRAAATAAGGALGLAALAVGLLSGASVAWWGTAPVVDDCAALERELDDTWGPRRARSSGSASRARGGRGHGLAGRQRRAGAGRPRPLAWALAGGPGRAVPGSGGRRPGGARPPRPLPERHRGAAGALVAALQGGEAAVLRAAPGRCCSSRIRRRARPRPAKVARPGRRRPWRARCSRCASCWRGPRPSCTRGGSRRPGRARCRWRPGRRRWATPR
ncbi:protein kinase domain-containing protein [Nannocystis pusilla]|uniref:protein kinase domain-containing protein n=1 Tax=Nannocystis pusilla TaxID=889268 RepID=UPI003B7FB270